MTKEQKVKHTPGPWMVAQYSTSAEVVSLYTYPLDPMRDTRTICSVNSNRHEDPAGNANAALIAAAPDLLAACRIAVMDAEQTMGQILSPGGSVSLEALTRSVKTLQAAIAKAEGKEI